MDHVLAGKMMMQTEAQEHTSERSCQDEDNQRRACEMESEQRYGKLGQQLDA